MQIVLVVHTPDSASFTQTFLHPSDGPTYKLDEVHYVSMGNAACAGAGARLHIVFVDVKQEWWLVITDKLHSVRYSDPVRTRFRLRLLVDRMVKAMADADWPRSLKVPEANTVFRGGAKGPVTVQM